MSSTPSSTTTRRKSLLRKFTSCVLLILTALLSFSLGAFLSVRTVLGGPDIQSVVSGIITKNFGLQIASAGLTSRWVNYLVLQIDFQNPSLFLHDTKRKPVFTAKKVSLRVNFLSLSRGALDIEECTLTEPVLYLLDLPINSKPPGKGPDFPAGLLIRHLELSSGQLHFLDSNEPDVADITATILESGTLGGISIDVSAGFPDKNGSGNLKGKAEIEDIRFLDEQSPISAKFSLNNCPAAIICKLIALIGADCPLISGKLDSEFAVSGTRRTFSGQLLLKGENIRLKSHKGVDPIPLGRLYVGTSFEKTEDVLTVSEAEIKIPSSAISFTSTVTNLSSDHPQIYLGIKQADVDLHGMLPLVPLFQMSAHDKERVLEAGMKGRVIVMSGEWTGSPSNASADWWRSLSLDVYLDRVSGFLPGFGLPVEDAVGRIRLGADEMIFRGVSFGMGSSPLVLNGWISKMKSKPKADLFITMNGQGQDLKPLLESPIISKNLVRFTEYVTELQGGVNVTLDVKGDLDKPSLKGKIDLDDFQFRIPGWTLPFRKLNGSLRFRSSNVSFAGVKGFLGDSPVEFSGDLGLDAIKLNIDSKLNPADLRKLNGFPTGLSLSGPVPLALSASGKPSNLNFSGRLDFKGVAIEYGLIKKKAISNISADFSGIRLPNSLSLEEAYLHLGDTNIACKANINSDSKVTINLNLPPKGIPTTALIPYLDSTLELQPGGRIEGDASLKFAVDGAREIFMESNVVFNHITLKIPGFHKRTEGLTGQWKRKGKLNTFTVERARVGNSLLSMNGNITNSEVPRIDLNLEFSFLDTSDFSAPAGYVAKLTWGEWIQVNPVIRYFAAGRGSGSIKAIRGKTAYRTFSDFRAVFDGAGGIIKAQSWHVNIADGLVKGTGVFDIREQTTVPMSLTFQGEQMKMESILVSEPSGLKLEGKVSTEGRLDWKTSTKRENNGIYKIGSMDVRVYDGVIHRFEILSKIFSLINLGSIVRGRIPDIMAQGLPFQKLIWKMEVFDQKWKIKDLKLTSDAARIDSTGMYFSGQERVDFRVEVSPLVGIDTIFSGLFGNLITRDGKTLTTTFRVRGLSASPDVRLEPFDSFKIEE